MQVTSMALVLTHHAAIQTERGVGGLQGVFHQQGCGWTILGGEIGDGPLKGEIVEIHPTTSVWETSLRTNMSRKAAS